MRNLGGKGGGKDGGKGVGRVMQNILQNLAGVQGAPPLKEGQILENVLHTPSTIFSTIFPPPFPPSVVILLYDSMLGLQVCTPNRRN